jgi:hypothetical protein
MDILDREAKIIMARAKISEDLDVTILKLLIKENHPVSHKHLHDIYLPWRYLCKLGI